VPSRRKPLSLLNAGRRVPRPNASPAVAVSSREAAARVRAEADDWVCLAEPVPFEAVGRHYVRFGQVGDDEMVRLLAEAAAAHSAAQTPTPPHGG
jgi:predicted phosphoribosyltransferase